VAPLQRGQQHLLDRVRRSDHDDWHHLEACRPCGVESRMTVEHDIAVVDLERVRNASAYDVGDELAKRSFLHPRHD
jgi:hypothetical protein